MRLKKVVPSADVIGNLNMQPVNCTGEYTESKNQTKVLIRKPNADSAGSSAKLIYMENMRERQAMQIMQDEMLNNTRLQGITNLMREGEMQKMNLKLRRRLIDVNFFLKDCAEKEHIAQKKVLQQKKVQEDLLQDIDKSKRAVRELRGFRELIRQTVETMSPYEAVLKSVVAISPMYTSVSDCMNRCDSLLLANHEIQMMQDQKLQELNEMRKRMLQITDAALLTVLGLKNELTELGRMYTNACGKCQKWERTLKEARATVLEHNLSKERILDGLYMLYHLMNKRSGHELSKDVSRKDVGKIMDYLRDEISLLNEVVEKCQPEKSAMGKFKSKTLISKAT